MYLHGDILKVYNKNEELSLAVQQEKGNTVCDEE